MSCSKPLPPFVCDSLYYLNRNQLERFSIVCRPLKNFIDRYLHTKPYRVFDRLYIRGGSYILRHNNVQWHPNRDDYSAQQFLAGEALHSRVTYYSFAEMRPFLGQTVRIERIWILVAERTTYNPEHIDEMESIAHLWCDRRITISKRNSGEIVADDIQLILNSPTILKCRILFMNRAQFSFKDYNILYNAKIIENHYEGDETDPDYWPQFLEQPGVKPLVVLRKLHRESINNVLDHLSKTFSSAVSPNAFKILFAEIWWDRMTEFKMTNETSGEKLELKEGLPTGYRNKNLERYYNYTLERSSI
ncbi:hypothetical protein Ddc_24510 [Ditylenchus destructor]|nr:hypothetical protein Ddc_24510 [Ditylenchus destructor]